MRNVRVLGKVEEVLIRAELYPGFAFVICVEDARDDD